MLFLYDIGLGAKCPGAETSWVRNVLSTKRLEGETSRWRNVSSTKRPKGETSRPGAKRHSSETSVIRLSYSCSPCCRFVVFLTISD